MRASSRRICRPAAFASFAAMLTICLPGIAPLAPRIVYAATSAEGSPDVAAAPAAWPFIRGANYNGHAADAKLADSWPVAGPPVLWTRELGQGYSAFTADAGRVYTQYQTLAGQFVICLDAKTGDTVWQYRYGWPYEPAGLYPGPRSTPTLSGGRVYFTTPAGMIGCLDAAGKLVWNVELYQRFKTPPPGFGYACSPVVLDDRVVLPVGGRGASIVALDARTGATLWQSGNDAASYTPVLPITLDGQTQIIGYLENALVCCDLATGKQLWRIALSDGYDEHAAWPIYAERRLWISGPFRSGCRLLQLSSEAPPVELPAGASKLMPNDVCSSVLVAGQLYGFDLRDVQSKVHRASRGEFRCLDFATAQERWSTDQTGQASVIVADGKLCLFNDLGELILARATPEKYEELARATVLAGEIVWTPPTLYDNCVYLRNHSRAVCVYLGLPDVLGVGATQTALTVADIPQQPLRDVSALLGVEPEYAMDLPTTQWLKEWYLFSVAILGLSAAVSATIAATIRVFRGHWPSIATARCLFRIVAFGLGAAGTTFLSLERGEFAFTWPVCLFVLFAALVDQTRLTRAQPSPGGRLRSTLVLAAFLLGCGAHYYLCRRLSLATEWAFLTGFFAAAPVCLLRAAITRRRGPSAGALMIEAVLTLAEFSLYYWASVGVMLWRCSGMTD